MKIIFQNTEGVAQTSPMDIGAANSVILQIAIDMEGATDTVAGEIFKNTTKIGTVAWSSANGLDVNFYTGVSRPIYVTDGDVIKVVTSTPSTQTTSITIKRAIPNISYTSFLPVNINEIKPLIPAAKAPLRYRNIRDAITYIQDYSSVTYSNSPAVNIETIRAYLNNTTTLLPTDGYVTNSAAALQEALNTIKPISPKEVFDSWDRFSNNDYYTTENPAPAGSEAAAWAWDDTKQSAVIPINSATRLGFVSKELVEVYDHEATVVSDDGDDDWNGLVMAFVRIDGVNYYLHATSCCDGQSNVNLPVVSNFFIRYNWNPSLRTNTLYDVNNGWRGKSRRIKVSRRGDQFTVYASRWNESNLDPTMTLSINLNDFPELEKFKGPQRYGYFNLSQARSYFKNIKFSGGSMRDTIVDATSNTVYKYLDGAGWTAIPNLKAADVYGSPRVITNPTDGRKYQISLDGKIAMIS